MTWGPKGFCFFLLRENNTLLTKCSSTITLLLMKKKRYFCCGIKIGIGILVIFLPTTKFLDM